MAETKIAESSDSENYDREDAQDVLRWLLTTRPGSLLALALNAAEGDAMQTAVVVNAGRAWREACVDLAEAEHLRRQIDAVRKLHSEFKIYDECRHAEHDEDTPVVVLDEVGEVCASGYQYSICRECCAPGDSQTVECVDEHDHSECWPCMTRQAVDEPKAEEVSVRG